MWHAWERREMCTGFWWESPNERDHWEDQGVGAKMGSEWFLGRLAWGCGLDSTGSGQGPVAGCCECGDESSGSCATELVSYYSPSNKIIILPTSSIFRVALNCYHVTQESGIHA
jgi:hypothetical protein